MKSIQSPNGCLLYDGTCGACTHFIGGKEKFFRSNGFEVAPIQEGSYRQQLNASDEEIASQIFLLKQDGSVLKGPNVYREIFSKIWWLKPISLISRTPVLAQVFDFTYKKIAQNRHRISQACGFQPKFK